MPYVIVQGNTGDQSQQEALAVELTETVATLFAIPRRTVVVAVHGGYEEIAVFAGGRKHAVDLEIIIEGAGIREDEIPRVVQDVTTAASSVTAKEPDRIMVLVKVPGGPHMKDTSKCCGIGGQLLG